MIIDLFLFIIGFTSLVAASISDIKTKEVPDFITYSMIFSGLTLRALYAFSYNQLSYFTSALIYLAIFFVIANFLYYTKQWGGGDSKLLIGTSVIFSTYPNFLLQYFQPKFSYFPLTIFINILIIGAIYSLIWTIILAIKNKEKFIKEFSKLNKKVRFFKILISLITILLITLSILVIKNENLQLMYVIFAFLLIFILYFGIFIKAVENCCMFKIIPINKLQEGDWIQNNIYYKDKLIYKKSFAGVTKKQINLIKKTNIKKVMIKDGIPFTSVFPLAFILSIIIGNPILYLI